MWIGDALVEIVQDAQVDRFLRGARQPAHLAVADAQQIFLPAQDARAQAEQLQRQAVFFRLRLLFDIAQVDHRLQQPVRRGLGRHGALRDLGQAGAPLLGQGFENREDLEDGGGVFRSSAFSRPWLRSRFFETAF